MKKHTSVRLSDRTQKQVEYLKKTYDGNLSLIIQIAIEILYEKELKNELSVTEK